MAENPRSFSPTQVEANRTRQQGGGVGQRELSGQRDAGEELDPILDANAPVIEPGDTEDLEAGGTREGIGHRADKAPSDREHGKKTREHNKDIVSRRV
jgi:hypothetical protein